MTTPAPRRPSLGFWTGTRPGLERALLASLPAVVVGAVVGTTTNGYLGFLVGFGMIATTVLLGRRFMKDAGPVDDSKPE